MGLQEFFFRCLMTELDPCLNPFALSPAPRPVLSKTVLVSRPVPGWRGCGGGARFSGAPRCSGTGRTGRCKWGGSSCGFRDACETVFALIFFRVKKKEGSHLPFPSRRREMKNGKKKHGPPGEMGGTPTPHTSFQFGEEREEGLVPPPKLNPTSLSLPSPPFFHLLFFAMFFVYFLHFMTFCFSFS